jgi:RNA polymerase sigma factor (sigma-70 family)
MFQGGEKMDKRNMEKVYEENAKAVYKYLFCLTHNSDLSEELTQETFYQATKSLDGFRGDCKISVWLCQIAKRLWYKEIGKKKEQSVSLEDLTIELQSPVNIERNYIVNMEKVELFKQLHNLDSITREVMYLRLTGELSFFEIGDILGKTETWARVTFYRGKQKLGKGR